MVLPSVSQTFRSFSKKELILFIAGLGLLVVCICLAGGLGHVASKPVPNAQNQGTPGTPTPSPEPSVCLTHECMETAAYMASNMNQSADPCQDFWNYACGGWQARTQLPTGRLYHTVRSATYDEHRKRLETVLLQPISSSNTHSYERKLKSFYRSCVDTYSRDKKGAEHLIQLINDHLGGSSLLGSLSGNWDFKQAFMKYNNVLNLKALFRYYVYSYSSYQRVTISTSSQVMSYVYFLDNNERARRNVKVYRNYTKTVGQLLMVDAGKNLSDPGALQQIDQFSQDVVDLDVLIGKMINKTYRTPGGRTYYTTVKDIKPNGKLPYKDMLVARYGQAGITQNTKVYVFRKAFVDDLDTLITNLGTNMTRVLNNYLVFYFAHNYATQLSAPFRFAYNYFREKIYYYVYRRSIEDDCYNMVSNKMKDAFGAEFVKMHLLTHERAEVDQMFTSVRRSVDGRVREWDWMENATQKIAVVKVLNVTDKIGYPDYLTNENKMDDLYRDVDIDYAYGYFKNMMNTNPLVIKAEIERLKGGRTRDTWRYPPTNTYTFYYPIWNEIQIPAGMIQFPYYWDKAIAAHKFGGIGNSMAEQLVRSVNDYDDSVAPIDDTIRPLDNFRVSFGRNWYANGSYARNSGGTGNTGWWTAQTDINFQQKRLCILQYYSKQKAGPLIDEQGNSVMLDCRGSSYIYNALNYQAGIRQGYYAYLDWVAENGLEKDLPGLQTTNEQNYFVAAVQTRCSKYDPTYAYRRAKYFAAMDNVMFNGVLANMAEFSKAFNCSSKTPLNPENACSPVY